MSLRSDNLDSVDELYTQDNFRQLVVAIEAPPAFFGDLGEFEDQGQRSLVRGTMRIMIKFTFPVDTGNDAIWSGKVEKIFKQIAQELKPEAPTYSPRAASEVASWLST